MIDPSRYKYLKPDEAPKETFVTMHDDLQADELSKNIHRLMRYRAMWDNMSDYRKRRQRAKDYRNGKQWNDLIKVGKHLITEEANIVRQGKVPLKNNVISHLTNTVLGTFRDSYGMPEVTARVRDNQEVGEMNTNMLEYVYQENEIKELDVANLLEFMLGGACCQFIDFVPCSMTRQSEIEVINVNPTRLILPSNIQDPRGRDIESIGILMDMSLEKCVSRFAHNEKEAMAIREIYKHCSKDELTYTYNQFGRDNANRNFDFFVPIDKNTCRVIQMWELESEEAILVTDHLGGNQFIYPKTDKEAIEAAKKDRDKEIKAQGLDPKKAGMEIEYFNDTFWYVRYFSPRGDILYEGRTPFDHNDHPFALLLGHLIDGEIHSYVESFIDQQRYINRLITLSDFIIGASAKGVLVFPENAIPKDMNKDDILEEWVAHNGVIFANLKPGMPLPQQISSNCTNIGINEMLSMQLNLIREISGIHGAMQGKDAKSGQSATLYQQESLNAQTNIRDLIDSFTAFRRRRDYKIIMIAPQCYTEEFYMAVSGDHENAQKWNPFIAASAPLYVQISETNNNVVYRSAMNEFLIKAMEMRLADLKTVLKAGTLPYSDRLIRIIEEEEKQAQQQQAMMMAQQMQGQAMGQQMAENGASEGQIMQAGADVAQQAMSQQEMQDLNDMASQADPNAMAMLQQAMA